MKNTNTVMSIVSIFQPKWRLASEFFNEDEEHERRLSKAYEEHDNAPFRSASVLYTDAVRALNEDFKLAEWSKEKWREEQGYRALAPVGSHIVLRRKYIESAKLGMVIHDTMMVRVEQPYRWECIHVVYTDEEGSPFARQIKKRKHGMI